MKTFDIVAATDKYKGSLHEFYLDVRGWRKFKTRYRLDWESLPFEDASQAKLPQEPGIYAFTIEVKQAKLPGHGYIMYVGKAGDLSDNTLRKRFSKYRSDLRRERGRPKVLYMMKKWRGDLVFNYASLGGKTVDLKKLEEAFINAVRPPINIMDFEAEVSAVRRAAF